MAVTGLAKEEDSKHCGGGSPQMTSMSLRLTLHKMTKRLSN